MQLEHAHVPLVAEPLLLSAALCHVCLWRVTTLSRHCTAVTAAAAAAAAAAAPSAHTTQQHSLEHTQMTTSACIVVPLASCRCYGSCCCACPRARAQSEARCSVQSSSDPLHPAVQNKGLPLVYPLFVTRLHAVFACTRGKGTVQEGAFLENLLRKLLQEQHHKGDNAVVWSASSDSIVQRCSSQCAAVRKPVTGTATVSKWSTQAPCLAMS
eukprot:11961-Heterococcus_DN1.PRE.2